MKQQPIGDFVTNGLRIFGKEVNTNRQLVLSKDGLKPIYRRTIYASLQYPDKTIKSATLAGAIVGRWHPHGTASVEPVISNLVRWGIFDGQGNHGAKMIYGDDISPAAARYTEAKISPKFRSIFSDLMPYVPFKDGELEEQEPEYIPTPIPLSLLFGGLGIGFGANMRIPAFTIKSIYNALIKDDPELLEAPFGLKLIKDRSQLKELWNTGLGRLTYQYQVTYEENEAGKGEMIVGDAELFKPNLAVFDPWINDGRVFILDLTDNIGRVFIGRNYNVRAISLDDIERMCINAATYEKTFRLTVADQGQVYLCPLKYWLRDTYENYLELVDKFKSDKLSKYQFDYQVYDNLPKVAECLFNNRNATDNEISSTLNLDPEIVSAIMKKSISTLRLKDTSSKLASIEGKINYFTNLDPKQVVVDKINEF